MKKKAKRVYVLGDARGVYRVQNVVKFFVDRPSQYRLSFNNYLSNSRPLKYLKSLLFNTFHVIASNIIYVSILNVDIDILYELLVAKIFGKKIVVDYYISIYEKVVVDEKWFSPKSLAGKLARKLDQYYYGMATKAIFLDNFERNHYCELIGRPVDSPKNIVIPLCVEDNFTIQPATHDSFEVCWWGSYLPLHGLKNILDAAQLVKMQQPEIRWNFWGNDSEKEKEYIKYANMLDIGDVCTFCSDYSMKNGLLEKELQQHCSLALGNFGTSDKARNVMTNKMLDACAVKCLILTASTNAAKEFFDGENDVIFCEPDPDSIAAGVLQVYAMPPEKRIQNIEKAHQIYQDIFSVNTFNREFEKLLNEL